MLLNCCMCGGCSCTMCADSSYCADQPTVSITHEGETTELALYNSQPATGIITLGEIMSFLVTLVGGSTCVPHDEEGVYPFCAFFTDSVTPVGPGDSFLYALLFYFDGSVWKLRILFTYYPGSYFAGYYKEVNLGVSSVNCDDLEIADESVDRCAEDEDGDPTETITINVTR